MMIQRALTDPAITPEKLSELYDFKLRLDARAAEIDANAAFAQPPKDRHAGMKDISGLVAGRKK